MAAIVPQESRPHEQEEVRFETLADLRHDNSLGSSRLLVTDSAAYRFETTPIGEELVVSYSLSDLSAPKVEDLVDASSLIVSFKGQPVELLRATSRRALQVAGAEKRLKAVLEGEEVPELDDKIRLCPKCGRPLPEHSEICEGCVNRGKTLLRLFRYAKPHTGRLVYGTLLTMGVTAATLVPPKLIQLLIDRVLVNGERSLFSPIIGAYVGSQILVAGLSVSRGRNVAYLGMQMAISIRYSLFEKLQALSLGFYDKRNVGSIISRMTNDTSALYDVLVDGIPVLINQLFLFVGVIVGLLVMNWRIGVWALLPIPCILVAVRLFRNKMKRVWSRVWHQWARLSGALNGVLQGTRVVKAFHGETREVSRFHRRIAGLSQTNYIAESGWATFFPMVTLTFALGIVLIWYKGGLGVMSHVMTIGELTAFIAYMGFLQQPLMSLQRIFDWSTRALTAAERVFEVLDTPQDIEQPKDAVPLPHAKGAVKFTDVHFGYEKAREVLHGIDLDVKPGEMIGLVGHSGAGKSTIINLLMRFYDPTQGTIELDGIDLRKIDLDDFRRQVGVVMQESYLFPGSIKDNIAYGRPECTMEEVLEASMAANSHGFVVNFPDGYDTYVGERGQRLSGGERQRIAIARAILHNPKVLILDEATASVDTETERMIQEAIERLVDGRTVFAIAHRLSTLRNADRLVVIDEGKIAEIGTHEELLAKEDGIYKKLVDMQLEVNKLRENFIDEE